MRTYRRDVRTLRIDGVAYKKIYAHTSDPPNLGRLTANLLNLDSLVIEDVFSVPPLHPFIPETLSLRLVHLELVVQVARSTFDWRQRFNKHLGGISNMVSLQTLRLRPACENIGAVGTIGTLVDVLAPCTALRVLDLDHTSWVNTLGFRGCRGFSRFAQLGGLESLTILDCHHLDGLDGDGAPSLLSRLTELRLNGGKNTMPRLHGLIRLSQCTRLQKLSLGNTTTTTLDIKAVGGLTSLRELSLCIAKCNLNFGAGDVPFACRGLVSLTMFDNIEYDDNIDLDFRYLEGLTCLTQLRLMRVDGCFLIESMHALPTSIVDLVLEQCHYDADSISRLTSLESLDLIYGFYITDSLSALTRLTRLTARLLPVDDDDPHAPPSAHVLTDLVNLRELHLNFCEDHNARFGNVDAILTDPPRFPNLRSLQIPIENDEMGRNLSLLTSLTSLHIGSGVSWGFVGSHVTSLSALRSLHLSKMGIRDDAWIQKLSTIPHIHFTVD